MAFVNKPRSFEALARNIYQDLAAKQDGKPQAAQPSQAAKPSQADWWGNRPGARKSLTEQWYDIYLKNQSKRS